ncbi:hypothetical protein [Agromyces sp. NPDC056965]|uniref:hypothetical protein n=1 Tax=Agromyces sp. NPDC056965 TaxID=3345983 RepID=UPI00362C1825
MKQLCVVLGLLGALGGCSMVSQGPESLTEGDVGGDRFPKDTSVEEMQAAVDDAVEGIEIIKGVESASSKLVQGERPDGLSPLPDQPQQGVTSWHGTISVDLERNVPDLGRLATEVEEVLSDASETVSTGGTLHVPEDDHGPRATLSFLRTDRSNEIMPPEELASSLELLRDIDGAMSAFVSQGDPVAAVGVDDPSLWPDVAAQLRELPDLGFGALTAVSIAASTDSAAPVSRAGTPTGRFNQLRIDATSPSPAFLQVLAELANDDDVVRLSYTGAKPESPASTELSLNTAPLERPSLIVEVEGEAALERVTAVLTSVDDVVTAVPTGVSRAEFDVFDVLSDDAGPAGELAGFVGLPLGSQVPDEQVVSAPDSATLVLDPGAADGRVAADRVLVTNLLDAAGAAAGIRGQPDVGVAECAQEQGEHAEGEVTIPIFEVASSADAAFAAITAAWVASGYIPVSSAKVGLAVYASSDPLSPGATTIAIRESAAGIRIYASSVCVATEF